MEAQGVFGGGGVTHDWKYVVLDAGKAAAESMQTTLLFDQILFGHGLCLVPRPAEKGLS